MNEPLQVASPLNDIQLVVLAASNMTSLSVEEAVDRAIRIVALSVVRFRSNALNEAIADIEKNS